MSDGHRPVTRGQGSQRSGVQGLRSGKEVYKLLNSCSRRPPTQAVPLGVSGIEPDSGISPGEGVGFRLRGLGRATLRLHRVGRSKGDVTEVPVDEERGLCVRHCDRVAYLSVGSGRRRYRGRGWGWGSRPRCGPGCSFSCFQLDSRCRSWGMNPPSQGFRVGAGTVLGTFAEGRGGAQSGPAGGPLHKPTVPRSCQGAGPAPGTAGGDLPTLSPSREGRGGLVGR